MVHLERSLNVWKGGRKSWTISIPIIIMIILSGPQSEPPPPNNKNEKKTKKKQVFRSCSRTKKKAIEYVSDGGTNCNWCVRNDSQRFGKRGWKSLKSEDEPRPSKLQHY